MERVLSLQTLSEFSDEAMQEMWSTTSGCCSDVSNGCSSSSNDCGGLTRGW